MKATAAPAKRTDRLGVASNEIEVTTKPVSQTTTTPAKPDSKSGNGSLSPYAFAAILAIISLVAIRFGWRRG